MEKIINWLKNHISIMIIIILSIPFFCIPAIGLILNIGIALSSFLPNKLIILRINTNEIVTQSEFIYYYSCFLSIEVTGILSYLLYKITLGKYSDEAKEKVFSEKKEVGLMLNEILIELRNNRDAYKKERDGTNWSFYKLFELENYNQFSYGQICTEFEVEKWEKNLTSFIFIKKYFKDHLLLERITEVYSIFDFLSKHTDKDQCESINLEGFMEKTDKVIEELLDIVVSLGR
ncbi:hypothetical protein [Clostridium chromiireducens]|uniref:Uncharacterized protein n=1 Tax=Clostridium chromiireducens TaxID=225345 RepID=A0A1V4IHH2_9CLOT|nr:hypothetical protein [Clostridium chromiireducens]OPJ59403.1 hypothetical protein CLCHR_34740 [Clostridium chromiireducens]